VASARCVLPAAPPPSPGELLASWVGRLACLYDAPPQDLWCELAGCRPVEFGWNGTGLTIGSQLGEQFSQVAIAARLSVSAVVGTSVSAAFPAAPATWLRSVTVSTSQVPWCPACLRDDAANGRSPYLRCLWAVGCIVICPRHRTPLVDTCPECGRAARPVFSWAVRCPVLICVACGAALHGAEGTPRSPDIVRVSAGLRVEECLSAAVAGIGWAQTMLLSALRGHPVAGPRNYRLATSRFIVFVESLVEGLLYPLGIARDAGWSVDGGAGPPRCTPGGLLARNAFAVMAAAAAVLALSGAELHEKFGGMLRRQQSPGKPIDLARLWTHPSEGGAVLCCDRRHLTMVAGGIGSAVALALLGDPAITAYMAASGAAAPPPCRIPEGNDRFRLLADRILTDPRNVARLAATRTPAGRRRCLDRLAREALQVEALPSRAARADRPYAPGRAVL
jgi:TniQ